MMLFLDEWELAQDFDRLPMVFALDKGVDVFIFERKRPDVAESRGYDVGTNAE